MWAANLSVFRTLPIGLGAIAMAALSGAMALFADDGPLIVVVGWIGLVLFGACAVGWLVMLATLRGRPLIEVDSGGILWRRWSDAPIPWDAIAEMQTMAMQGQTFLVLRLFEPERYRSTKMLGRLAGINKAMGFGDIAISALGTDRSFAELVAAVQRFAPAGD